MTFDNSIKDFFSIFITPRQTIRRVLSTNSVWNLWAIILSWSILEIAGGLLSDPSLSTGGDWAYLLGLALSMLVMVGLAAAFFYLNAWLVWGSGKMLSGRANFDGVLAAGVWCMAPLVVFAILKVVLLLPVQGYMPLFGEGAITIGLPLWVSAIVGILNYGGLAFGVWGLVSFSRSVAEVQEFKTGVKGFWNVILPWLIIGLIVFLLAMVVAMAIAALKQNGVL